MQITVTVQETFCARCPAHAPTKSVGYREVTPARTLRAPYLFEMLLSSMNAMRLQAALSFASARPIKRSSVKPTMPIVKMQSKIWE